MNNRGQQKHAVIPINGEMQAICVEAALFLSALFARFPYPLHPHPCCSHGPPSSHTGQQEIGIQCFLDDFLKEMNLSRKMRTMNNGTLGGMCLTRAVRTTCAAAESHVWNRRLWSQGWKEPWLGPLEWGQNKWIFVVHTQSFDLGKVQGQSAPVRINLALYRCEMDFIFFLYS